LIYPEEVTLDESREVAGLRRRAGLTQQQLADASGVAQPNIAAYERGTRVPSAKMLARLAEAARPRPSVVIATRKAEITRLARRHRGLAVKVFGSAARGDDRPGSDLDLLVTFASDASLFDQVGLAQDLEDLLGVHVDVISDGGLRQRHEVIRTEARPL
jgi:predicted nucleotidyltransferase